MHSLHVIHTLLVYLLRFHKCQHLTPESLNSFTSQMLQRAAAALNAAHGRHLDALSTVANTAERRLAQVSALEQTINTPLELEDVDYSSTAEQPAEQTVEHQEDNDHEDELGSSAARHSEAVERLSAPRERSPRAESSPPDAIAHPDSNPEPAPLEPTPLEPTPLEPAPLETQPPAPQTFSQRVAHHVARIQVSSTRLHALWEERAKLEAQERDVVRELESLSRHRDVEARLEALRAVVSRVEGMLEEGAEEGLEEEEEGAEEGEVEEAEKEE
jgi:hypothetical protein